MKVKEGQVWVDKDDGHIILTENVIGASGSFHRYEYVCDVDSKNFPNDEPKEKCNCAKCQGVNYDR